MDNSKVYLSCFQIYLLGFTNPHYQYTQSQLMLNYQWYAPEALITQIAKGFQSLKYALYIISLILLIPRNLYNYHCNKPISFNKFQSIVKQECYIDFILHNQLAHHTLF